MPRINAILFDKDGTLFDFDASWAQITAAVLDRIAPSPAHWCEMALAVGFDPATRRFAPGSPIVAGAAVEVAGLWARYRRDLGAAQIEAIANAAAEAAPLVTAVPDLPDLLDRLAGRGLRLGVATHDSEAAARSQLAEVGAGARFDFIAGYDSGHGLKPAPGMLAAFAAATGVTPGRTAIVGDSRHDLEMAPRGGAAMAVGVLTGPAGSEDLAAHAHHILPSIGALPDLLDRVASD